MRSSRTHLMTRLVGAAFLAAAVVLNEWLLGRVLSPDQAIENLSILWFIRGFQLACMLGGASCVLAPHSVEVGFHAVLQGLGRVASRPVLVVALAIVCGLGMRAGLIAAKPSITHDEAFSYIVATGHQGEYNRIVTERDFPAAHWARAGDWQPLWSVEAKFPLRQIGADLAAFDYHPPLYFWLLHLAVLIGGVHPWTGSVLNLLIFPLTVVSLYGLSRRLLNRREASWATFLWALSPVVAYVTPRGRPYELYALWVVLCAWLALRCSDTQRRDARPYHYVLLMLVVAAALLTHYHAGLVVAAAGLIALWRYVRTPGRRPLAAALALLAGAGLLLLLHPNFAGSFHHSRKMGEPFALADLPWRFRRVVFGHMGFFSHLAPAKYLALSAGLILGLWAVLKGGRRRLREFASALVQRRGAPALFFLGWCVGSISLLYLSFITPRHAIGTRYLTLVWPFLAIAMIYVIGCIPHSGRWVAPLLCVAMFLSAALYVFHENVTIVPPRTLSGRRPVVVDNLDVGHLPRLLWHMPPGTRVFAARQEHLLRHTDVWMDGLGERAAYISEPGYVGTERNRDRILEILRTRYVVEKTRRRGLGTRYLLQRSTDSRKPEEVEEID